MSAESIRADELPQTTEMESALKKDENDDFGILLATAQEDTILTLRLRR